MRIVYILSEYPKASETFIRAEIEELIAAKHQVLVVCYKSTIDIGPYVRVIPSGIFKLLTTQFWALLGRWTLSWKKETRKRIWKEWRNTPGDWKKWLHLWLSLDQLTALLKKAAPDLIVGHFQFKGSLSASLVGNHLSIPVHLRLHTPWSNLHPDNQQWILDRMRSGSTVSLQLKETLPLRDRSKLLLIRQSLNWTDLLPAQRRSKHSAGETLQLIAAGRFIPKKGFEFMIEALSKLKGALDFEWNLYGEGPLKAKYSQLINEAGLEDRVFIHETIAHGDLMLKIAESDLLLVPSIAGQGDEDGIPTVIPEAMFLGTIVIATAVGGIPELIEKGQNGWLVSEDEDLKEAILTVVEKEDQWPQWRRRAMDLINKEYKKPFVNYINKIK